MILFRRLTVCFCALLACLGSAHAVCGGSREIENGYRQMYNLDFNTAHTTFQAYQQQHPDDPLAHVSNAAAYLFAEFDRMHVLEMALFANDSRFEKRQRVPPDAATKAAFEQELAASDQLAAKRLAKSPQDVEALFSQILANGLRGDYAGLVEKRNLTSLGYMKTSRGKAEELLHLDPSCYDAYLAVGVENYLLGIVPAPVRWVLRMTGSQTDKTDGIQKLHLTAEKGYYLAPFARLLLAVVAVREKDPQTARNLLSGLAREFPQNHLYSLELARLPST